MLRELDRIQFKVGIGVQVKKFVLIGVPLFRRSFNSVSCSSILAPLSNVVIIFRKRMCFQRFRMCVKILLVCCRKKKSVVSFADSDIFPPQLEMSKDDGTITRPFFRSRQKTVLNENDVPATIQEAEAQITSHVDKWVSCLSFLAVEWTPVDFFPLILYRLMKVVDGQSIAFRTSSRMSLNINLWEVHRISIYHRTWRIKRWERERERERERETLNMKDTLPHLMLLCLCIAGHCQRKEWRSRMLEMVLALSSSSCRQQSTPCRQIQRLRKRIGLYRCVPFIGFSQVACAFFL